LRALQFGDYSVSNWVGYFEGLWVGRRENIGAVYLGEIRLKDANRAILEASLGGVFEGLEGLHVNLSKRTTTYHQCQ